MAVQPWSRNEARMLALMVMARVGLANIAGAVVVFVYFSLFDSTDDRQDVALNTDDAVSLGVFVVFMLYVMVRGYFHGRRRLAPLEVWVQSPEPVTPTIRRTALRMPFALARWSFGYWVLASAVFGALNATAFTTGPRGIGRIVIGIVFGGLSTSALTYMLVERRMRPAFALVLPGAALARPATLGVRPRLLLAWILGSAMPLLAIASAPLAGRNVDLSVASLAVIGIVGGAILLSVAARSVAEPLDSVRAALERVRAGDLGTEVAVDDGSEVGMLQAGFNEMVAGLQERKRLQDLFGRHVGEEVARLAVERGSAALGGEVREVSALFVDVTRSTHLAAVHEPQVVVAMLNDLFRTVVAAVDGEGGWVNKFEGDGALCVFGAPADQSDHPARALRAARAIALGVERLRVVHPDLDVGVGVSSGRAVAGNVGSEDRYEYTVIGDPVNESARLTELAKERPGRVLVSEAAVLGAGEEAGRWRPAGQVQLRGRAQPTRTYEPAL